MKKLVYLALVGAVVAASACQQNSVSSSPASLDDDFKVLSDIHQTKDPDRLKKIDQHYRVNAHYDKDRIRRMGGDWTEEQVRTASTDDLLEKFFLIGNDIGFAFMSDPDEVILKASYASPSTRELLKRLDAWAACLRYYEEGLNSALPKVPSLPRFKLEARMYAVLRIYRYPSVRASGAGESFRRSQMIDRICELADKKGYGSNYFLKCLYTDWSMFHPRFKPKLRSGY